MNNIVKKFGFVTALLACAISAPLAAEPIEEKNIEKGKDRIATDQGYIFMHGDNRFAGMFLKIPSADDIAAYESDWEEKFAKAYKKYERRYRSYEFDLKQAQTRGERAPEKPIEPTAENFAIDPIEFRNLISFGPMFVYNKEKSDGQKSFSYLEQVEPGTYVYYGPIINAGNGVFGHCLCMGSIQFEVKSGMITNLGDILLLGGNSNDGMSVDHDAAAIAPSIEPFLMKYVNFDLPASLQEYEREIPDFRASAKYPNRFGIMISRMRPIEGVLDYDLDRPIDVKAELARAEAAAELSAAASVVEAAAEAAETENDVAEAQDSPADTETASEAAVAGAAEPE